MKEIYNRLKAETPVFFKRVKAFGLSLSAAAGSLLLIPGIPEKLQHFATEAIWIGGVIAVVAQLTCSKPEDLK